MSYLVLARKWRPQKFDDVIGQEPIIRILKNSIDTGKIAHAYIFSGPRGVGKTSTARILAKALNCINGPTSSPCGKCTSCTSITEGYSIDVMEIDGASNNSVNDIRDLRERVKYVPSGGKYKIYIIDETHMLSDSAFNALLKTLEEPPSHIVFVLATTAPKKIPLTVISRCQHLPFRKIPSNKISNQLKEISEVEKINISDSAIEMISRAADGSLRDALMILDQISSFSSDINETDVKDILGITDFGILAQLSVALIEGKREELLMIVSNLVDQGTDIRTFIKELIQFLRNLLVASVVKRPEEVLDVNIHEMEVIKDILKKTSEDQLTLILSGIMQAEIDVKNASSPRLAFEMSLIKVSFLSSMKPIKEILENLNNYSMVVHEGDIKDNSEDLIHKDNKISEDNSIKNDSITTKKILDKAIDRIEPPLKSKLLKAHFKLDGNILNLTFNGGDSLFVNSIKEKKHLIEKIFSEEFRKKVEIKIEETQKNSINKKELKEKVLGDPAIKNIIKLFNGKIVDVFPIKETRYRERGG